jgi:hypothetical protein
MKKNLLIILLGIFFLSALSFAEGLQALPAYDWSKVLKLYRLEAGRFSPPGGSLCN